MNTNVTRDSECYRVTNALRVTKALLGILLAVMVFTGCAAAQNDPAWTEPFPPFHIAGNLYYVGSKGLANYLITTAQGHILINGDPRLPTPIRSPIPDRG